MAIRRKIEMAGKREAVLEKACREALALVNSDYTGPGGEWIGDGRYHGALLKAALEPEEPELHAGHMVVDDAGEVFAVWEVAAPMLVRRGGLIMRRASVKLQLLTCATCDAPLVANEFHYITVSKWEGGYIEKRPDEYVIAICSTCYRNKRHSYPS